MMFNWTGLLSRLIGRHNVVYVRQLNVPRVLPPIDHELYNRMRKPLPSVQNFFRQTLPSLGWTSGEKEETVMDVGCGNGLVTTKWVAPLFPSLKNIIAVDLLPSMIEIAKDYYPHQKVEYKVGTPDDWSTIELWEGQMTKIISVLCFHWLDNQRESLQNIYKLLQPSGEAGLFFVLSSNNYRATVRIAKDPKWNRFFQNVNRYYIPISQLNNYDLPYYKDLATEAGFSIKHAAAIHAVDTLSFMEFKNFFTSICVLFSYVPDELKEEFQHELTEYCLLENDVYDRESPVNRATMIELVLKKE